MQTQKKYMRKVCDWREEVGYYTFLREQLADFDKFHNNWPNNVYGMDDFGHFITGFRIVEVNTGAHNTSVMRMLHAEFPPRSNVPPLSTL